MYGGSSGSMPGFGTRLSRQSGSCFGDGTKARLGSNDRTDSIAVVKKKSSQALTVKDLKYEFDATNRKTDCFKVLNSSTNFDGNFPKRTLNSLRLKLLGLKRSLSDRHLVCQ
jgi:hypothetical protein